MPWFFKLLLKKSIGGTVSIISICSCSSLKLVNFSESCHRAQFQLGMFLKSTDPRAGSWGSALCSTSIQPGCKTSIQGILWAQCSRLRRKAGLGSFQGIPKWGIDSLQPSWHSGKVNLLKTCHWSSAVLAGVRQFSPLFPVLSLIGIVWP